jgi:decaprenylphospho-beta-D-ribofuranose 2-oxidase
VGRPVEQLSGGPALEEVAGWGRHPVGRGRVERPEQLTLPAGVEPVVPRGLGRAYGDPALPSREGGLVLESTRADRIRSFEPATGRLHCEAGLSLAEILRVFVPRGWFPPVTPGTKFVTVGACVACDVHGKNHHRDGSFGSFVDRVTLRVADGRLVECGPDRERELFLATLGGMGLTGLIVEVILQLKRIESPWIVLETQGMASLDAMMEGLRLSAAHWPYTVGWIDCLARGADVGRGILMRGRHATQVEAGTRRARPALPLRVPFDAPEWLLNPLLMRGFNRLYAWSHGTALRRRVVSYDRFFYPLDAIAEWNRLYGRRGLLQYQCVLPRAAGSPPVATLLERLGAAGAASFLAVIKDCGPASDAYLSFPMEGTTLALDLPNRGAATEALIHELNAIVIANRGRVYLAKDAVTRAEDFARMEPRLGEWRAVRERWDPARRFRSAQSVRLFGDPA